MALLPLSASAFIDIVHEATFVVPHISGEIQAVVFGDVNHDGFPEFLIADNDSLRLYSLTDGQDLFVAPLDTTRTHKILLADITGDSTLDVIIGSWRSGSGPLLIVEVTPGDFNYDSTFRQRFDAGLGIMYRQYSFPFADVAALDVDHDGTTELVISRASFYAYFFNEFLDGATFYYENFMDSVATERKELLLGTHAIVLPDRTIITAGRIEYNRIDFPGVNYTEWYSKAATVGDNGAATPLSVPDTATKCSGDDDALYVESSSVVAGGDIAGSGSRDDLLVSSSWSYSCVDYIDSTGEYNSSGSHGAQLNLLEYVTPDSTVPLWSLDITDKDYSHFIYDPDFPGTFFAISEGRVFQFDGTDGSLYQFSNFVPAGHLQWDHPYGDNRLRLVSFSGDSVSLYYLAVPTGTDDAGADNNLPVTFELYQNYPNPFNPSTTIEYSLPRRSRVVIEIFNVLGRNVRRLVDEQAEAGRHRVVWDGRNDAGRPVASGVYLYRLVAHDYTATRKMLLLK
ncbi:MAG: T9SS C-terminal target domain-containing protein [Candidatus Zixiibacteriota bacterium]|nr:MAG: T9SS C-terminal target domain-containing protein [candidate division Zixibacteria bacterium]